MKRIKIEDMTLDSSTNIRGVVATKQQNRLDGFELAGNQSYTVFQGIIEYLRHEGMQNNVEQGYSPYLGLPRGRQHKK